MSQFSQPGVGGDKFEAARHAGHLLLIFPSSYDQNIPTINGSADAVSAKIVDLDTGEELSDAKVWGKAMVPQLKGSVPDGMVLGRLAQGQGKPGNTPPWLLQPHTEQDVATAERYLAANPRNQFANAAPQQQAPAATYNPQQAQATGNGWGQQQAAPAAAPAPEPAQQGGWGAPAPAPAAPAQGGWGAPAPAPAPEPDPTTYEEFVAAFKRKGVDPSTITSPEQAAQVWALVKNNPNVA